MADDGSIDQPEDFGAVGELLAAAVAKYVSYDGVGDALTNAGVKGGIALWHTFIKLIVPLAKLAGEGMVELEEPFLPAVAAFAAPVVASLFGSGASVETFTSRADASGREQAARNLVDGFMAALAGDGAGGDEATDAGAKRIATAAVAATLESSFQGIVTEVLSDFFPFEVGHISDLTRLSEEIIRSLGVSRLVRRAFAPLVDATAATPMKWAAAKTYRQNLLSEATAIQMFLSGRWSASQTTEELARLGYSPDRIDALTWAHSKFVGLDDTLVLAREGTISRDFVLQNLRDQGWDADMAALAVEAADEKRRAAMRDDSLAALRAAYVDRRLSESDFRSFLPAILLDEAERSLYETAARTIRDVNTRRLSRSDAEAAVRAGILAFPDYRALLLAEGYSDDDAQTLELLLRHDLDTETSIAQHKADADAERAAAQQRKDAADQQKLAALEAQRALARLGPLADLKRAAVLGQIPIARVEAVLTPQYDADTVSILVGLIEHDRQAYLDQQAQRAAAAQRATQKHLDVGQLEAAVLEHVLTFAEFRQRLTGSGLAPADVDVLVATLTAKQQDLAAAQKKHDDAAAASKRKAIDLGRFELLVRRGHRTLADYDALLQSLGFDDASRAAMRELLQLHIDDDAAAAKKRAEEEARLTHKGVSLEAFRRGVVLGLTSLTAYDAFLVKEGFTADAVALLVAEAQDDAAAAAAARARRQQEDATMGARTLPLSTVERAVRLGLVSLDAYRARLTAAHYTADDIALDLDLLTVEMARVAQARHTAAGPAPAASARGLSLGEEAKAVKAGAATIDDYRARAITLGYGADDVALLVATLQDELDTLAVADARHRTIDGELTARNLSLGELEAAVKGGLKTLSDYRAELERLGYGSDDAELLTSLLETKLGAAGGGA